jgi:hypothetical protein
MERFNLKKLNDVEIKEQYQAKVSNRFTLLENLDDDDGGGGGDASAAVDDDDDVDINRAWENITENKKASATDSLGYYELKQHKPW